MSIHDGHRQRVKQRFRQEGLDGFSDIHVIELLLFYCVPRRDTNPLAHRLLDHFGSLHAVLEASTDELEKVEGVNEHIATFLSLLPAVNRVSNTRKNLDGTVVKSYAQAGTIIRDYLMGLCNETVCMLCMDAKGKMICLNKMGEGSVNSANVPVRRIVNRAISANATSVIIGHNHPGGIPMPSQEDVDTTHYLAKALNAVDIQLLDHIVVSDDEFVSMAQSNLYRLETHGRMTF